MHYSSPTISHLHYRSPTCTNHITVNISVGTVRPTDNLSPHKTHNKIPQIHYSYLALHWLYATNDTSVTRLFIGLTLHAHHHHNRYSILVSQCRLISLHVSVAGVKLHALVVVGLGIVQAPRGGGFRGTAARDHAPGRGNRLQVWVQKGGRRRRRRKINVCSTLLLSAVPSLFCLVIWGVWKSSASSQ